MDKLHKKFNHSARYFLDCEFESLLLRLIGLAVAIEIVGQALSVVFK